MSKIIITDILYNTKNIDNNSEFILIHNSNIMDLLLKVDNDDTSTVFDYNYNYISKILKNYGINICNFKFLYHIRIFNNILPKYILLANNLISKPINNYTLIDNYGNGTVWYPTPQDNYYSLGLFYSNNFEQPKNENFGMLNGDYLIKSEDTFNNDICSFLHPTIDNFIILKKKILNKYVHSKLNNNNKYLTHSLDDNLLKLKDKEYSKNRHISYNPQGELTFDNNIMDENSNSWSDYEDNLNKNWSIFQENPLKTNYTGEKVILVNAENPWFNIYDNIKSENNNLSDNESISTCSTSTASNNHNILINKEKFDNNISTQELNAPNCFNITKIINLLLSILVIIFVIYLIYKKY